LRVRHLTHLKITSLREPSLKTAFIFTAELSWQQCFQLSSLTASVRDGSLTFIKRSCIFVAKDYSSKVEQSQSDTLSFQDKKCLNYAA